MRWLTVLALCLVGAAAEEATGSPPLPSFHLTARPWEPLDIPREAYLERIEDLCRFVEPYLDEHGVFWDPVLGFEHQYSVPYLAFAMGVLVHEGRTEPWLRWGTLCMDRATACVGQGRGAIPDSHGEFYLAPLAGAIDLYAGHVDAATLLRWRERLRKPVGDIIDGIDQKTNNWRSYAMKGEWARVRAGLVSHDDAVAFIEDGWRRRTQRVRIADTRGNLYQDWNGDPQSLAVEAVGRGNLLALALSGYDGPSGSAIGDAAVAGSLTSLLLQDPSGQCPPNGRTDNHVFNDVLYQAIFDEMAEHAWRQGDTALAGQYRHAAMASFASVARWRHKDGPWKGMYGITKNFFDPKARVGYQPASQISNYTATVLYHTAEAYLARETDIPEAPSPAERGGYVYELDGAFGAVVANAGGLQVVINLRGDSVKKYGDYWTPMGLVRIARAGWDTRLGPSDGHRDGETGTGISFGPTWKTSSGWVRLAEMAEHYRGHLDTEFVHPLLVRFSITYAPVTGVGGPIFTQSFLLTPDGMHTTLQANGTEEFGLLLPVLENDGRALVTTLTETVVRTRFDAEGDEQSFIALDGATIEEAGEALQSAVGKLKPYRIAAVDGAAACYIYPRSFSDPEAESLRASFQRTASGFESMTGTVDGSVYRGRYAAGGFGDRLEWNDIILTLQAPAQFFVTREAGLLTAIEADRDVTCWIDGTEYPLEAFVPLPLSSR